MIDACRNKCDPQLSYHRPGACHGRSHCEIHEGVTKKPDRRGDGHDEEGETDTGVALPDEHDEAQRNDRDPGNQSRYRVWIEIVVSRVEKRGRHGSERVPIQIPRWERFEAKIKEEKILRW